jgi:hypothetical protein
VADVKFKSIDLGKGRIERQLKLIPHRVALIGIPGTAKMPKDGQRGTVDNLAELAFIMEKGSTVNKIPPRPFMRETRKKAEKRFKGLLRKSYKAISNGKLTTEKALATLGQAYEGEMKEIFLTGHFEPNSYITIHGGWMRNKVSGKPFKVEGKKSSKPLINTGNLRQSIKYKVKKI